MTSASGTNLINLPVRPEGEPMLVRRLGPFFKDAAPGDNFDFMKPSQRAAHQRLTGDCFSNYDREMALVADHNNPGTGMHEILAVGRFNKSPGANGAEYAVLVRHQDQRRGSGTPLCRRVFSRACGGKLRRSTTSVQTENAAMFRIGRKLGFRHRCLLENPPPKVKLAL